MNIKITNDGFVWMIVSNETAKSLYKKGDVPLYLLYSGDSECLIEDDYAFERALHSGLPIVVEVGFVKDMLLTCPKCGEKMIPSRNDNYSWECLNCDEDFSSFEI